MKIFAPTYYKRFKCIADKCKHSCCIGWEIDIDERTLEIYRKHKGSLKESFEKYISEDDIPHFLLDNDERCPFLNNMNLCDIYSELGEECLCQICTDHPRFRNFYTDRTEIGLGLCCEEACRIILENETMSELVIIDDDGCVDLVNDEENAFFNTRQRFIDIISDEANSFEDSFEKIFNEICIKVSKTDYLSLFDGLEYMNNCISDKISNSTQTLVSDIYKKRLAAYFIYRHLADSIDDGLLAERIVFSYVSVKAIEMMCTSDNLEDLVECARIYSTEIEYSEENVEEILYRIGDIIEIQV